MTDADHRGAEKAAHQAKHEQPVGLVRYPTVAAIEVPANGDYPTIAAREVPAKQR